MFISKLCMYVCGVKTKSIIKIGLFLAVLFPVYDATGKDDDQVSKNIYCSDCWGDVYNGSYKGSCSFFLGYDSADHICDPEKYYGKEAQQKSWCPTDKGCILTCEGGMDDGSESGLGPDYACGCIGGWKCTCGDNAVAAQPHEECNVAEFYNHYEWQKDGVNGFRAKDNTECEDVCIGWYLYKGNCCATKSVKQLDVYAGPYEGGRNREKLPYHIKYGDTCITTNTSEYFEVRCGMKYAQIDPDVPPVCKLSTELHPSVFSTKTEDCTGCSEIECEKYPQYYICADTEETRKFIEYWDSNKGMITINYKLDSSSCGTTANYSGVTGSITENPELFVRVAVNQYSNGECGPVWTNEWSCRPGYMPVKMSTTGPDPNFICELCPVGTYSTYGNECEKCPDYYYHKTTIVTEMKNGVEVVTGYTDGNVFYNACKECPQGYELTTDESGVNICSPCGKGKYGAIETRGSGTYNICKDCSDFATIFTSEEPDENIGKINTSKTSCYFNAADVVLEDNLGRIPLNEEIGSVKLYYQGK